MGAWIEIDKYKEISYIDPVAPLVGAWIEIRNENFVGSGQHVAPLVGAWIEILLSSKSCNLSSSLPLWERGLKFAWLG